MKTRLLLIILMAPMLSLAQLNPENNGIKPQTDAVRSTMGLVHVLDSTKNAYYISGNWEYDSKKCIYSRHWGSQGLPKEWIHYYYDASASQWSKYYLEYLTYFDDSTETVDVLLARPWNSFINDWDSDTIACYDYTGTSSTQHGGLIYENTYVMGSYDFNTNCLVGGMKYEITLLNDTLYDTQEYFSFNPSNDQWEETGLYKYEYDENYYLQRILSKAWDPVEDEYINSVQNFYVYENGVMMKETYQNWTGTEWHNNTQDVYEYNANNDRTKHIHYIWDDIDDAWEPSYQYIYTYTGNLKTETLKQVWNSGTSAWDNNNRHVFTYNTNQDLLVDRYDLWQTGAWVYSSRLTSTYNTNNQKTVYLRETYDNSGMVWENDYRYTYSYDGNDNQINNTKQSWDDMASVWENDYKYDYTFDSYNSLTLETYSTWDDVGGTWEYSSKSDYYWSDFDATSVSEILSNKTSVFPNPTSGQIRIDSYEAGIQHITISDISGKVVFDAASESFSNTIDLRPYGRGLYTISITTENNEVFHSKIVVQ